MADSFPFHGALPTDEGTTFRVWAPDANDLTLELDSGETASMSSVGSGVFERTAEAAPGTHYRFHLDDDGPFPDPASRFQPDGVHGPSEVVDPHSYEWHDGDWRGVDREDLVLYEIHVGTFTEPGTFEAVREQLSYLKTLGVTALELMPVHDFPGRWNWGYDPAALFAPSRAYGAPDALRRLVDAAHRTGLAVVLDVIYNHFGPDGAYANAFAPFLTEKYETPWGPAINLDDDGSAGVRRFFIDNALHWLREYRVDGLRLDATHALYDESEPHFLADLSEAVDEHIDGFDRHLIAEDHRNLNRLVQPRDDGYGLDAVWSDDLHHQLRVLTAGDREGYYQDFLSTTTDDVATTLRDGWFFRGRHSDYLGEPRGTDPGPVDRSQCVVFIQNHDQVGNRPTGNRLTDDIPLSVYRALSVLLCIADELPLLFMGQEWAASSPFQFFTDHNEDLGPLVTEGRKEEFENFPGFEEMDVPDPQDPATFERSKLDWDEPRRAPHDGVLALYRDLLTLRPELGEEFDAQTPTDTTLRLARPPYHGAVNLESSARVALPDGLQVVLHTEQGGYTSDPRPPRYTGEDISFARPGAIVLRKR